MILQVDFSRRIPNLDGTAPEENPKLSDIAVQALVSFTEADKALTGQQKFELANLAQKIYKADIVDIELSDLAKIKERIGSIYPPVLVKGAWDLLENK